MSDRFERGFKWAAVGAVILWLAGAVFVIWVVIQLINILRQAVA